MNNQTNINSCILVPLFDVISTRCKQLCNEQKPHVKMWLMLTSPKDAIKTEQSVIMSRLVEFIY